MLQKFLASVLTAATIILPSTVLAANNGNGPFADATKAPRPSGVQEQLQLRPTLWKTFSDDRPQASGAAIREQIRNIIEQRQQLSKQQHAFLQNQIAQFKDIQKKERILKIDEKIASISSRRTDVMLAAVNKLQTILDTISSKAAALAGCDTSALQNAISNAQNAIASASSAISTQATKTYTINVSSESAARAEVGQTVKQLTADLSATHKTVVNAKQAVMNAAKELNKARNACKISVTPVPTKQPTVTEEPTEIPVPTNE